MKTNYILCSDNVRCRDIKNIVKTNLEITMTELAARAPMVNIVQANGEE
jgi:hypothetical protein